MLHKVVQLGGKSYFWLEKTNVVSMIQEYQVSGFRVREYEELESTNMKQNVWGGASWKIRW